jgi:hypothetical protein
VDGNRAIEHERARKSRESIKKTMSADYSKQNSSSEAPHLLRRFGLLEATALNMTNMIGIGPFITDPFLLTTLGGTTGNGWLAGGIGDNDL